MSVCVWTVSPLAFFLELLRSEFRREFNRGTEDPVVVERRAARIAAEVARRERRRGLNQAIERMAASRWGAMTIGTEMVVPNSTEFHLRPDDTPPPPHECYLCRPGAGAYLAKVHGDRLRDKWRAIRRRQLQKEAEERGLVSKPSWIATSIARREKK